MKKIFLSIFLFCGAMFVHAGGVYYLGRNQLTELIQSVESKDRVALPVPTKEKEEDGDTWKDAMYGITWSEKFKPAYREGATDDYKAANQINWAGKKYLQKENTPIVMKQSVLTDAAVAEKNDLRYLNSINFSDNNLCDLTFDANNQPWVASSLLFDLSNNIGEEGKTTWKKIAVKNFVNPSIVTVDISNNNLSFAAFEALTLNVQSGINVIYTPQTINKTAVFPTVDLNAEFYSAQTAYTFYYNDVELVAETDYTDNADGTFTFKPEYLNKTISCKLTDPTFTVFDFSTNSIEYKIALAGNPAELASVNITPKASNAFIGEPVQFTATASNYENQPAAGVTYLWSCPAGAGSFDNATSATPKFTPSIAGNVEIKCVATQGSIEKDNAVTITPVAVNTLELVFNQFYNDIHVQSEVITVPVKVNGTEITRATFLNALTLGDDLAIQNGKLVYTPSSTGSKSVSVSLGSVSSVVKTLIVVDNNPISKLGMTVIKASSEDTQGHTQGKIIDGDDSGDSRWAATGQGQEWITIDLGNWYNLNMLQINWETASAGKYDIYYGGDLDNLLRLAGQEGVSMGPVKTRINCSSTATRYIKILCLERFSGSFYEYSIYEIYAYGTLTSDPGTGFKNSLQNSGISYADNELSINAEGSVSTTIYSVSGQKILATSESTINVSALAAGCYIVKVINENGTATTAKFVK